MTMIASFILFFFVSTFYCQPNLVKTSSGLVEGVLRKTHRAFLGIPFATPPVGDLRWTNPVPNKPWAPNVYKATEFAASCPQDCDTPPHTCPDKISEDCLYLNVFTPLNISKPQPVMYWIHGGHFDQGGAGLGLYDGASLVETSGLVVVTVAYRLGVLGWMASNTHFPGNYGFLDQQLALKWVQQNIANFGGDPNQVTLFGQSAGGTSIRAHLVAPSSKGLFHRVIVQSDPYPMPMLPLQDAADWAKLFQKNTGCNDDLKCLKNLNTTFLVSVQKETEKHIRLDKPIQVFLPLTPVVDKKLIPFHYEEALKTGKWNQVPVLAGTTSEDALLFIYKAVQKSLSSPEYAVVIGFIFGSYSFRVMEKYRPYVFGDNRPVMSTCGTDYIFTCGTRHFATLVQNHSSAPVYLYNWNHALSFDAWGPGYPKCVGQACHGSELPLEFMPSYLFEYFNVTKEEFRLSYELQSYFTNFARTGDPNSGKQPGLEHWPRWDPKTLKNMEFKVPKSFVQTGWQKNTCDFWDKQGYHFGW